MTQISHRKKGVQKKGGGREKLNKWINKMQPDPVATPAEKSISGTIHIGREIKLFLKTNYHQMFCILLSLVPALIRPMREPASNPVSLVQVISWTQGPSRTRTLQLEWDKYFCYAYILIYISILLLLWLSSLWFFLSLF